MNRLTSILRTLLAIMLVIMLAVPAVAEVAQPAPAEQVTLETEAPAAVAAEPVTDETVLAKVNGIDITYKEVKKYFEMLMSQYGSSLDTSAAEIQAAFKNLAISYATTEELMKQKAHELGTDVYTDEELAQINAIADQSFDGVRDSYKAMFAAEGVSEEDQLKSAEAFLESNGYLREEVRNQAKLSDIFRRTFAAAVGEITLTDEDVRAAFDKLVSEKKATYEADLAQFDKDQRSGTVYYTPEGVRSVKHILIKVADAAALKSLNEQLAALEEGDESRAEIEAKIGEIMATVQPKLDEVQQKLAAGEDFAKLIADYGEDGGMTREPYMTDGYYVSEATTVYDQSFKAAAMALENVGDVSEPTLSAHGYHIIRYDHDVVSGEADFEALKETLRNKELTTLQTEAESAALQSWSESAVIETFPERYN